ncbi:hypothetical protein [Legionella sp.]|uniref:hypothetical protein n=1 Tax=Legionella sp. TaxID=459 RepID=UPI003D103C0F
MDNLITRNSLHSLLYLTTNKELSFGQSLKIKNNASQEHPLPRIHHLIAIKDNYVQTPSQGLLTRFARSVPPCDELYTPLFLFLRLSDE